MIKRELAGVTPPPFVPSKKKIAANDEEAKKLAEVRSSFPFYCPQYSCVSCRVSSSVCCVSNGLFESAGCMLSCGMSIFPQEEAKKAELGDLDTAIADLAAKIPPTAALAGTLSTD